MNFRPIERNDSGKNYFNQFQNGRVVDITKQHYNKLPPFTNNNNNNNSFKNEALKGIQQDSTLSFLFFSNDNMSTVQKLIRYHVWLQSSKKWIIGDQSAIELEIVMRSIYLQYSENLNCKFREQINKLNSLVTNYCVSNVLAEVQQYLGYLDNVQNLPNPIPLPQNLSTSGTKTLRSVTTTF